MKIYYFLIFSIAIYASESIQSTFDFNTPIVDSIENDVALAQPDTENIVPYEQKINYIPVTIINYNVIYEAKIDEILNTLFFSLFKNTISFFLYNISVLKPIFITIHNMNMSGNLDVLKFKTLLFKYAGIFKVHTLRELFKTKNNADALQMEHLIQSCKAYLHIRGTFFENLEYKELKKRVFYFDPRFYFTPIGFATKFQDTQSKLFKMIHDHLQLDTLSLEIFLDFISLIHDLTSNFRSVYHHLLSKRLYPALKDYKTLFDWIFDATLQISQASFIKLFYNEDNIPCPFYLNDIQLISGFVITLFKVVQASQFRKYFLHDIFGFEKNFFSNLTHSLSLNSFQVLNSYLVEKFISTFMNFLNEIIYKRNELKDLEKQTGYLYTYQMLNPIVNEFFRGMIKDAYYFYIANLPMVTIQL